MEKNSNQEPSDIGSLPRIMVEEYFLFSYKVAEKLIKADNFFLKRHSRLKRFLYFLITTILVVTIYYVTPSLVKYNRIVYLSYLLIYPLISFSLLLLFAEGVFKKELHYKVSSKNIRSPIEDSLLLEKELDNIESVPIGISHLTTKPTLFKTSKRTQHIMISGATGQGKSSLAISLRRHDLLHKRPIIDIDPKGSNEDIGIIKEYCNRYGRLNDFKHFDITNPETSFQYNPLLIGSVDERIEKITTVLELDNEFYRGFASNIFSLLFQSFDALNIVPTMSQLCELLIDKASIQAFFKRVLELKSEDYQSLKKKILAFKDFDKEKILGIQAKISRMDSPLFASLLNPSQNSDKHLDLISIVKKNQYAYFQLNIAQYKEISTYLINFILYDLKLVCGAIDGNKIKLNADFLPVYIDEFSSFGNKDFPEFLRVARSGKVGITVMFQNYSSLDEISPSVKDEITTNTIYSIHFNPSGSANDIGYIAQMAGTVYINQRSFQVLGNGINPDDGSKGTQFRAEELKIDPNILRNLKMGEAIVYLKDSNEVDLVHTWHGKRALSLLESKDKPCEIKPTNQRKSAQLI